MVIEIKDEENFIELLKGAPLPIVIYGAGKNLYRFIDKVPRVDMICDKKRAGEVFGSFIIQSPEYISELARGAYVIVTVAELKVYEEIKKELNKIPVKLYTVYACGNESFSYDFWSTPKKYQVIKKSSPIKINIVCADGSWIFEKFAIRMEEHLLKFGVDVSVGNDTRKDADINHHIPYIAYHPYPNDTLMITHVDNLSKVNMLKKQLRIARVGICMSRETMMTLTSYGIDRSKLCYINPAHDNIIRPHKYIIGITHKCHDSEDLRKKAGALVDVVEGVDCNYFKFFIMGYGWNNIVNMLRDKGFEVEYYDEFNYEIYTDKMQEIDYFMYMGFDEGTMGYLDALAAGAGTIVTPQGYHLDTGLDIDYPCRNIREFHDALLDLQYKRKKRVDAVKEWTWENYTKKHLKIWNYILKREPLQRIFEDQHEYNDGIYSLLIEDNRLE